MEFYNVFVSIQPAAAFAYCRGAQQALPVVMLQCPHSDIHLFATSPTVIYPFGIALCFSIVLSPPDYSISYDAAS